ncbi:hypothetical protein FGO68_gene14475 [Halteria grandinella]|uniref:Uncharacterized protein n=1 Tax=Halteria grandinella TaxID=5974 RepID=A0A8J8NLZ2_HALGN|nr:hypothetical protein FGO68_gene14475 [Halteria grandinella]
MMELQQQQIIAENKLMNLLFNPIRDYFKSIYFFNDYAEAIGLQRFEIYTGRAKYFGQWYLRSNLRIGVMGFMVLVGIMTQFVEMNPGDPKIASAGGVLFLGLLFAAYDLCLIPYILGAKKVFDRNQQKTSIVTLKSSGFQADEIMIRGNSVPCHTCFMPIALYNQLKQSNISHISDQTLRLILNHNSDLADPTQQRPIFLYTQTYINKILACSGCITTSIKKIKIAMVMLILYVLIFIAAAIQDIVGK